MKRMSSSNSSIILILASFVVLSTGVASSKADVRSIVVADLAQNIQQTVSDDGARVQISYEVEIAYPNLAVDDSIQQSLESRGWAECSSKNPKWNIYEDASRPRSKVIHSNVSYRSNEHSLMTIASTYYSDLRGQTQELLPDNEIQYVVILIDYFHNKELFWEAVRRLQIHCG